MKMYEQVAGFQMEKKYIEAFVPAGCKAGGDDDWAGFATSEKLYWRGSLVFLATVHESRYKIRVPQFHFVEAHNKSD